VKLLVTSRERLRINGEQEMPVLPLTLPDRTTPVSFDVLCDSPAVRLFTVRTHASDPAFSLSPDNAPVVAEVCRRLDGLPLAIELAAAHAKVLPPHALLARLERRLPLLIGGARDAPARQRTMRDTIAWSHDLLSAEERELYRKLAVFAGGCTLEAAAWVSDANANTLDLIGSLVDRSLLSRMDDGTGEPRFRMLETIREFAWEQLAASGEDEETRGRHAVWCLALAERCSIRDLPSGEVRLHLDRLEAERDNMRAALACLLDSGETETALRLGTKLHFLWTNRGPASEGRVWLKRALAAPAGQSASPAIRGLAAQTSSILAWMEGAFDEAAAFAEQGLALSREGGVDADCVWAINLLGMAATSLGRYGEAAAHLDEALALYYKLGAGRSISIILTNRAVVSEPARARGYLDEALALCQQIGAPAIQLASSSTSWVAWTVSKATSSRQASDSVTVSASVGRPSIFGRCRKPWRAWPAWPFRRRNRCGQFACLPPRRRYANGPALQSWWPIAAITSRSCSAHVTICHQLALRPRGTRAARCPWTTWLLRR